MDTINFSYQFNFKDHEDQDFILKLDSVTLSQVDQYKDNPSSWTELKRNQCDNCTLNVAHHSRCPLALSLEPLIDNINSITSFDHTKVTVKMNERTISNDLSAQDGLSALFGILTATSECPHTQFLKPMARFHLPFANERETFFRAASIYMLAQYYRHRQGKRIDLEMSGLYKLYEELAIVNQGISKRIRAEERADGALSAVLVLDMYAQSIGYLLDDTLAELAPLFKQFTDNY